MEEADSRNQSNEARTETLKVSPEDVAKVLNNGVAEVRLKRSGVERPTTEQIKAEADKIPHTLVGQDLEQVKARQQYNLDVAEWIASVTGGAN